MAPTTPVNTINPDLLRQHLGLVDKVAAIAPAPKPWTELRQRFEAFTKLGTPQLERLTTAIIDGTDADHLGELAALASAEASGLGAVNGKVRKAVLGELRRIYAQTATANYSAVGKQFDAAAQQFAEAAAVADPEADSATLIGESERVRKAWLAGEVHAGTLTKLVPVLAAAAALAGVAHTDRDTARLSLTVDARDLHRRRVWEAWTADGRCSRWSALHKLGVRIRACPLDEHQPYREPLPLQERERFTDRGTGELYTYDPEDHAGEQDPEPVKPRQRAAFLR